jgi:uncharacterized protein YndB with AHSA1/START domain
MGQTTQNSRMIKASQEKIYQALTNPKALEAWQAPGEMTAKVHSYDLREGGGYTMSLYYPETEEEMSGKTSAKEDRFSAKFIELVPNKKIIQSINFDSNKADFSGEMIMEITLEPAGKATKVSFLFKNIPKGIRPEDNEAGTRSSLEKLAKYVESV